MGINRNFPFSPGLVERIDVELENSGFRRVGKSRRWLLPGELVREVTFDRNVRDRSFGEVSLRVAWGALVQPNQLPFSDLVLWESIIDSEWLPLAADLPADEVVLHFVRDLIIPVANAYPDEHIYIDWLTRPGGWIGFESCPLSPSYLLKTYHAYLGTLLSPEFAPLRPQIIDSLYAQSSPGSVAAISPSEIEMVAQHLAL